MRQIVLFFIRIKTENIFKKYLKIKYIFIFKLFLAASLSRQKIARMQNVQFCQFGVLFVRNS